MSVMPPSTVEWLPSVLAGDGQATFGGFQLHLFLGEDCTFLSLSLSTDRLGQTTARVSWRNGRSDLEVSRNLPLPQDCASVRYFGLSEGILTIAVA